ncbi:translation elongation factor 4 [Chlorobium ferrooxidans]|uniref:Elongation factor 4 n=1 Tax=Chlorobium ferrooxidans DSM 13031 TaxID=377431 RepID=Q0YS96_9CHLB|nr:translation elongation factor 4 [Chlorobium ferrooxidans]EAT59096.1 Small GTP-binding protein domain [Chlorobium ferrooxidans DSM 13031]
MALPSTEVNRIRNFCIIAHIDHGKSTLADRLLEITHTLDRTQMASAQVLDDMDLERERGITIKSHAIQMKYKAQDGIEYTLNLIDTPGHVDFSYEVSRSLAACEGALLVVDATQGVEAQTIANLYLAIDAGLDIIPVINKIDLPSSDVEGVARQVIDLIGVNREDIIPVSAKAGIGVDVLIEAIVKRVPAPADNNHLPLRALIFDSVFDAYRGAVIYLRIVEGSLRKGDRVKFFANDKLFLADEIGTMSMKRQPKNILESGDVGYLICSIKDVKDAKVGDTVTLADNPAKERLAGYKDVKPMVFSGLYPINSNEFEDLRESLEKLALNDASLVYTPETSVALGFGFRCGFLGLLHMEIIQERLEREYGVNIITTVPNVEYRVMLTNSEMVIVDNPSKMPEPGRISLVEEPYVSMQIITLADYIGNIMKLGMERRGEYKNTDYLDTLRVIMHFEFPLAEIVFDFHDRLKSISKGYASMDYEYIGYRESELVKLDVLLNGDTVDALSIVVHRSKAYDWGKKLCIKLKAIIPKQMYEVAIQAAIGSKVISRETISAMRKNVLAKCYGGDISRKRKLLEKQKEGKKRMKQVGRVEVPQEAFLALLNIDE